MAQEAIAAPPPYSAPEGLDLGDPKNEEELGLLSMTGMEAPFKVMGLRPAVKDGRSVIVRGDGTRASPDELEELKRRVREQPRAKLYHPHFDQVLKPREFQGLKQLYRENPSWRQADFKHIELADGNRDFRWSESCSKVSGECNPRTTKTHYKKGEYVAPEDLKSIWDDIPKLGPEEMKILAQARLAREKLSRSTLGSGTSSPGGRLTNWLRGMMGDAGGAANLPAGGAVSFASAGLPASHWEPKTLGASPLGDRTVARTGRKNHLSSSAAPPRPAVAPGMAPTFWPGRALAATAGGGLFFLMRRRRKKAPGAPPPFIRREPEAVLVWQSGIHRPMPPF